MEELPLYLEILFLHSPTQCEVILFGQYMFVESATQSLKISHTFHAQEENDLDCIFVIQLYSEKSRDKL